MYTPAFRRLLPAFLATSGCRRLSFSTTRATLHPRKWVGRSDGVLSEQTETPVHNSLNPKLQNGVYTDRETTTQTTHEPLSKHHLKILNEFVHPDGMIRLQKRLPMDVAAKIINILGLLKEGERTPQAVVSEVESLVHKRHKTLIGSRTRAIYELAHAIKRPGETPNAGRNGDLIARLLLMAAYYSRDRQQGFYQDPLRELFTGLINRNGGGATLLYHKLDVIEDFKRFLNVYESDHASREHPQIQSPLAYESEQTQQDAMGQRYIETLIRIHQYSSDNTKRVRASFELGYVHAFGALLPRDGQKAKFWWERAFYLAWKTNGIFAARGAGMRLAYSLILSRWGHDPLFAPDMSKGLQYLQLLKWACNPAARTLADLYYISPNAEDRTVENHISIHGVAPDDALAANYFFIGALRHKDPYCLMRYVEMLYLRRADPPVDSSLVSLAFLPQFPLSSDAMPQDGRFEDDFDLTTSLYDQEPVIEFAPRPRLLTLDYAYQLVNRAGGIRRFSSESEGIAHLREAILKERKKSSLGSPTESSELRPSTGLEVV